MNKPANNKPQPALPHFNGQGPHRFEWDGKGNKYCVYCGLTEQQADQADREAEAKGLTLAEAVEQMHLDIENNSTSARSERRAFGETLGQLFVLDSLKSAGGGVGLP